LIYDNMIMITMFTDTSACHMPHAPRFGSTGVLC